MNMNDPISEGLTKRRIVAAGCRSALPDLSNLLGAAAIVETMNEMAEENRLKSPRNVGPSPRKKARPENKAKRKIAQASRKQNRYGGAYINGSTKVNDI